MAANVDGAVVIDVDMDVSDAEKELSRLKRQVFKLEGELQEKAFKRSGISSELVAARKELKKIQSEAPAPIVDGKFADNSSYYQSLNAAQERVAQLTAEHKKINDEIEKTEIKLDATKARYGEISQRAERASEETGEAAVNAEKMAQANKKASGHASTFGKRIKGIVASAFIFNILAAGLRSLTNWLGTTVKSSEGAQSAMAKLKGALLTLAQPIVSVAIPAFEKLINVIAKAIAIVAAFVSGLFGSTAQESANAAESLYDETQAIKGVGGAASKAAKSLASFDEINKISGETAGGGGGGGSTAAIKPSFELPIDEEMLNRVSRLAADIRENFTDIAGLAVAIGTAIGLWKLNKFLKGLSKADTWLGKISKIAGGLIVSIMGFSLEYQGFKEIGRGTANIWDYLKTAIGTALGIGVGVLALTTLGLSAGAAFAITIPMAIGVAVAGIVMGKKQAAIDAYNVSELGQTMNKIVAEVEKQMEVTADLRVHIASITGEMDEKTQADFSLAQKLVDEIFSLDAEENKTAAQMDILREKIELLNSLGLDGVEAHFDETTGHIVETKAAIEGSIESLLKQYKLEAARGGLIDAYEAQFKAETNLTDARKKLREASEAAAPVLDRQRELTDKIADAQKRLNELGSQALDPGEYGRQYTIIQDEINGYERELDGLQTTVEQVTGAVDIAKQGLLDTSAAYDAASEKVGSLEEQFTSLATEASTAGADTVDGYAEGVTGGIAVAEGAIAGMGDAAIEELKKKLDSHSPSKVFQDIGADSDEGYALGITENKNAAVDAMTEVVEAVKAPATESAEAFKGYGSDLVTSLGDGIVSGKEALGTSIKSVLNDMLGLFESFFNKIGASFNTLLSGIKNVESVTGGTVSYTNIPPVKIPRLATGAVIPPNREFMAVLGDQKSGTNIEAPLTTIEQAVSNVIRRMGGVGGNGEQTVIIQIDGREFGRFVRKYGDKENKRIGASLVGV